MNRSSGGTVFSKALTDGLALFYIAPDWRTYTVEMEVPNVAGKMKLIPLPGWEKGGRRTSTWGGSGVAITRATKNPELAWELAKTLYFDKKELGKWMDANFVGKIKRNDKKDNGCETCHGDPFEGDILKIWAKAEPKK